MTLSTFKLFKKIKQHSGWIKLNDVQLKEFQKLLLNIVDDVLTISEENNLHVMLSFGSVLGAYRHHGFIPWDDDIDICVYREEYEKFVSLIREKYSDKYWIHTPESTPQYGTMLGKILLKGTVVRKYDDFGNKECGAYIDIFVIENTFDNPIRRMLHIWECYIYAGFVSCRRFYEHGNEILACIEGEERLTKIVKIKIFIGRLLCWRSLSSWVIAATKCYSRCKDNNSKYVFFPQVTDIAGVFHERSLFGKGKKVPFEDREFRIPFDTEKYLEAYYGDFLKVPPPEDRETHLYLEFKI